MPSSFLFTDKRLRLPLFFAIALLSGCGRSGAGPEFMLTVSLSNPTVDVTRGGSSVYVPVIVMAPTESVTFTIQGLPAGVSESYKESESNPSGQLTLAASASAQPGTYKPTIVVGTSGQTATCIFTLVIHAG